MNSSNTLGELDIPGLGVLERHVYFVALFGLAVFYGLETWVRSKKGMRGASTPNQGGAVFLLLAG